MPSDRPQDHLGGKLPTFESLILSYLWCSSPSRHATASTRLDRQHQDATEPSAPSCFECDIDGGKKIRGVKIQIAVEKCAIPIAIASGPLPG